jgi:hypothetical protein
LAELVVIPTAVPTDIGNAEFAGALRSASRVMMTEDAKFALGF